MSIFGEYSGPSGDRGYYSAFDWNMLQNPGWASDQAEYDRFAAQAAARAEGRAEAMSRAREAIPFSYTQFGRGGTEPVFSLAGYSGHTSGGTAGLSGFSGTGSPVVYSSSGGVILPVQHMQEGGMIQSPYANPMKASISAMPMPLPQVATDMPMPAQIQPAIGGLFQNLHSEFGQQMGQMQSQPLKVYQNYLMQTYAQPEMQAEQQKVDHFLDLVDQAERAHFGAEESFGFGGGPMAQQYQQALPAPRGGPMPGRGIMGGGIASLMGS
jgi:hypothetical protein